MDEINIEGKIVTYILSKIISKQIKNKINREIEITINKIKIFYENNKIQLNLDIHAEIEKDDFIKILKEKGTF